MREVHYKLTDAIQALRNVILVASTSSEDIAKLEQMMFQLREMQKSYANEYGIIVWK